MGCYCSSSSGAFTKFQSSGPVLLGHHVHVCNVVPENGDVLKRSLQAEQQSELSPDDTQARTLSRTSPDIRPDVSKSLSVAEHGISLEMLGFILLIGVIISALACIFVVAVLLWAPWWGARSDSPPLRACTGGRAPFYSQCNGWFSIHDSNTHCRNFCGLEVVQDKAWDPLTPAFNGSRLQITDTLACAGVGYTGTKKKHDLAACAQLCTDILGMAFYSPLCWSTFAFPNMCLKARTASWAHAVSPWIYHAAAVAYTAGSLCVAFKIHVTADALNWRWATEVHYSFPLNYLIASAPEQHVAWYELRKDLVFMLIDRFTDITALPTYLRAGQALYAICWVLALCFGGDPLQIHGLVEYRKSVKRGNVGTRGFAANKAKEALHEGCLGVLLPLMAIMQAETMNLWDLASLVFAMLTSFLTIFSGAGGAHELASAMESRELMPFAAQKKFQTIQIKWLRVAEIMCFFPVVLAVLIWGCHAVYAVGAVILGVIYVGALINSLPFSLLARYACLPFILQRPDSGCMGITGPLVAPYIVPHRQTSSFQVMNPKAFGIVSIVLATLMWPIVLMWPGSFYDPSAHSSRRCWYAQVWLPVMPPVPFYVSRFALSVASWILILGPHLGLHQVSLGFLGHFSDWHQALLSAQMYSWLAFVQLLLIVMAAVGPVLLAAILALWPAVFQVRDSDVAIKERCDCLLFVPWLEQRLSKFDQACAMTTLGFAHLRCSNSKLAAQHLECALPILEELFGTHSREVATLLTGLGNAKHSLGPGQIPEAMQLLGRALEIRKVEFGNVHPDTIATMSLLGAAQVSHGQLPEGVAILEQAAECSVEGGLPRDIKTAHLFRRLGWAYTRVGRNEDAQPLLEQALQLLQMEIGSFNAVSADLHALLGRACQDEQEAATFFEYALEIFEAQRGPENISVARTTASLAEARIGCHQPQEAMVLLSRALPLMEATYGIEDERIVQLRRQFEIARVAVAKQSADD